MRSHKQIIEEVGDSALVDQLGVTVQQPRDWRHRDSIPAEYWRAFAARGWAQIDELAEALELRRGVAIRGSGKGDAPAGRMRGRPGVRSAASTRTAFAVDDELVAKAQRMTGFHERSDLVREALEALIQRESARRLARLGGSEPALEAPRRRRAEK